MEISTEIYDELLGICLTDNSKIPYVITKVSIDSMPVGKYRIIYNAIVELYNLGVDIDIVTVSNRLLNTNKLKEIGGRSVVNDLALNSPSSRYTKKIVDEVCKQNIYRMMSTIIDDFKDDVNKTTDINSTCIDYCSKISSIVTGNLTDDKLTTISSGIDEVISDLYTAKEKGCVGLDCGYSSLNYFLGGLQKGKVYVVGARPSMGKSSYAMNIAEYVSKDKNVLFISLEMGRKEYAQRLMFAHAGIDISCVNTGKISEQQIDLVKQQKEYLDSLNLFIETKTPCRISDIELAIINLQASKGSCDLVIVDYLQLLTPSNKTRGNRETEVSEMSRELKSLAVKYNVPIIVLSQLSRSLEAREDKRPMLSDLRESGAIEQDADVVMFLYRDEYYHPDVPESRGEADVLIRKNRGGINNRDIKMCWQPSKVKFTESIGGF